jgi:hypothetical protein
VLAGSPGDDAAKKGVYRDTPPEKVRVWEELAGQANEVNKGEYWRMVVKRWVLRVRRQGAKWEKAPFRNWWVEEGLGEGVGNPPGTDGCRVGSRLVLPDLEKLWC